MHSIYSNRSFRFVVIVGCTLLITAIWPARWACSATPSGSPAEFIQDGGFELGIVGLDINRFPRYQKTGSAPIAKPFLESTNPLAGRRSLVLPGLPSGGYLLITRAMPLVMGAQYSFSAFIDSASSTSGRLEVFASGWRKVYGERFELGAGKTRFQVGFTASTEPALNQDEVVHVVRLWIDAPDMIRLDSVSVTGRYGTSGPPVQPVVGISPDKSLGVYSPAEAGRFSVRMLRTAGERFSYDIVDPVAQRIVKPRSILTATGNEAVLESVVPLVTDRRGFYWVRMFRETADRQATLLNMRAYVVVDPGRVAPEKLRPFGLAIEESSQPDQINAFTDPAELFQLTRQLGVGSVRVFSSLMPDQVSDDGIAYTFHRADQVLALANQHDIEPFFVLGSNWLHRIPRWLRSGSTGESTINLLGGITVKRLRRQVETDDMPDFLDLTKYSQYLNQVFTKYRGRIHYYELWNEPGYKFAPSDFARLARATRVAQSESDPDARLMGFSSTIRNDLGSGANSSALPEYLSELADRGGLADIDILSYHSPHAFDFLGLSQDRRDFETGFEERIRKVLSDHQKSALPLWDSETGLSWISAHRDRLDAHDGSEIARSRYEASNEADVLDVARQLPMIFAAGLANGVARGFWFNLDGAHADISRSKRRWEFFDAQLEPMPQLPAFDAMTDMLAGASFVRLLDKDNGNRLYYFRRGLDTLILAYNWQENNDIISIPHAASSTEIFDIMGNRADQLLGSGDSVRVNIGRWPVYIVLKDTNVAGLTGR